MQRPFIARTNALLALALSMPALAQETPQAEEQSGNVDIVVTAQRRAESVQDVPIAISAFSSEQLANQGVNNTLQLAQYIPNLTAFNNTGLGSANGYFLRGLGNTETIATFDPPVGTYVDDIYLSRQNANNLAFFDVERIEVLRGPQGTLFGRNTTGGAINVIMRDPGDDFGGYAELGYGRFDRKLVRASVDVPLAPTFHVKVSGFWQDDKGYVKNVTTGDRINDDDGWGVRLGLKGELSDSVRWKGSFAHTVSNGENLLNFECNPANQTQCNGRFVTTGLPEGKTVPGVFAPLVITGRKANFGLGNRVQNNLITSNLEFDLSEDIALNLITGFVDLKQQFALDFFDGRGGPTIAAANPTVRGFPRGGFTITNDGQHTQFTQEVKLAGSIADGFVDFVGGVFYINERNRTDFADTFTLFFPGLPGNQLPLLLADRVLRNMTEAYAGYVQADFNVTDAIKLTAGIRYTDERKTFRMTDNRPVIAGVGSRNVCGFAPPPAPPGTPIFCIDNSNLIAPNGTPIPDKQRAKIWTPRFAVNFKPSDDFLIFASATRGFKSGGWNARATASASQLLPFDPEKVWSYEAGIKSDLWDNRVRANLTVYYADVTALQTPSAIVAPNGSITFITRNFADYENKGAELELTFVPVDGMNLFVNVGYQDDKYKIPSNAPTVDQFGIQGVRAQQAACRAQLALGQIPGAPNTAPAGQPVNNAPSCGAGIVDVNGNIATPVRTPKWTLSMGASYKAPIGGDWTITPSVNASYASKAESGTANLNIRTGAITGSNGTFPFNPFTGDVVVGSLSQSHWIVNAGLTLKAPEDRWQIGVECTNCFSESYTQSSLANYSYLNRPMEWMVRAKYNF